MTKKHFELIAELLNRHVTRTTPTNIGPSFFMAEESKRQGAENVARDMADLFKEFNPLFDVERFLKACGL